MNHGDVRLSLHEALDALPDTGERWVEMVARGSLRMGLYVPRGADPKEPHEQDEIYIIISGSGVFVRGDSRSTFRAGDALFVPAGATHHFEDSTEDLAAWVMFYGPPGGELPATVADRSATAADVAIPAG